MIRRLKIQRELRDNQKIQLCAAKFGITGDKTRMKICYLLCHYPELSVSHIAEFIGSPISTVSHSLTKLKAIQLVENRRNAKERLYSLSTNQFAAVIREQLLTEYE